MEKEQARQGTSNIGADGVVTYDEARSGEVTMHHEVIFIKAKLVDWWKKNEQFKA